MDTRKFSQALGDLIEIISKCTDKRYDDEIRTWIMSATLRIWAGNKLCAEEYAEALTVFSNQEFSTAQVVTALNCAGDEERELVIPEFFKSVVENDKKKNTAFSRDIADSIGRLLVVFALVNGDFTIEEAAALKDISDQLIAYCDHQKIKAGKEREYHPDLITPINKTSYYQSAPEKKHISNEAISLDLSKRMNISIESSDDDSHAVASEQTNSIESFMNNTANEKVSASSSLQSPDESKETLESVLAELNGLVGLDKVKNDVQSLLNFIKVCRMRNERGMKVPTISYHLVFTGNPGTGKTTVARMVAKLYYLMGILPQGQLVETDRSGLVAGYLGQTAIKTQEIIQKALGGVLFIDEAYSLVNDDEDSYGKEAIETILKAMEDHRDELVVIVAGYDELMTILPFRFIYRKMIK